MYWGAFSSMLRHDELRRLLAETTYQLPAQLSTRQRVALLYDTNVSFSEALALTDSQFNAQFLLKSGISGANIILAKVDGHVLRRLGFTTGQMLLNAGLDSLHLVESPDLAESLVEALGADEMRVFLTTPRDAVALAGECAADAMALTPADLLNACADAPEEAQAVLTQLKSRDRDPLGGVVPETLILTGINATELADAKISLQHLILSCSPTSGELVRLKYNF